jgi:predicted Fe-S protein YdhL (DUF1289 family)
MIDPRTGSFFCCGRTLPEYARWHGIDSAERRAAMAELPQRMADGGLPTMATDPERE